MKKTVSFIFIIMSLLCLIIPQTKSAQALKSVTYARIINDSTPFYSDSLGTELLFYLPYTYYVKILDEVPSFYHVEYCGYSNGLTVDGYVPKDVLYFDGQTVENPYPSISITLSSACTIYSDTALTKPITHAFSNRIIKPYGINYAPNGSNIYYISYNNILGYVQEDCVTPFTLNNHPNPLTFLDDGAIPPKSDNNDNVSDNLSQSNDYKSLKTVIIICLIFAGIIGLFVGIKTKSNKTTINEGYYDENEYE